MANRHAVSCLRTADRSQGDDQATLLLAELDAALEREDTPLTDRLLALADAELDPGPVRRRGAQLALLRGDPREASCKARQALAYPCLAEHGAEPTESLLTLATAMSELGEAAEALATAIRAGDEARGSGLLDAELAALVVAGRDEVRLGRLAIGTAHLTEARDRAAAAGLVRTEAAALHDLACARRSVGALSEAEQLQRHERVLWQQLGLAGRESLACSALAITLLRGGRHDAALDAADQAHACAMQGHVATAEPWAASVRGFVLVFREGASPAADAAVAHAVASARALPGRQEGDLHAAVALLRAILAHLCGEPATALAHLDLAGRWREARHGPEPFVPVLAIDALARLALGDIGAAAASSARAVMGVAAHGGDDRSPIAHYAHARILRASGAHDQAAGWLVRGQAGLRQASDDAGVDAADLAARDPWTRALSGMPCPQPGPGTQVDLTDEVAGPPATAPVAT